MSSLFLKNDDTLETQFRSIYLLGSNTATYKFALAKSLLNFKANDQSFITLDEITPVFSDFLLEHVKQGKQQIRGQNTGKLLHALKLYSENKIERNTMLELVRIEGFKYVLDAFHRLPNKEEATPFFHKGLEGRTQGIYLTDDLNTLFEYADIVSLTNEVEGRWALVDSTWSEKNPIQVKYDLDTESLFYLKPVSNQTFMHSHLRTNLTPIRKPLNGYQKGHCFYCGSSISIDSNQENTCDVDHVIPLSIQYNTDRDLDLNGVWNLVLACKRCNRVNEGGKGGNVPLFDFIELLYTRNEYFIESTHPLRETIIAKMGKTTSQRRRFILERFNHAAQIRKPSWFPKEIQQTTFNMPLFEQ